MPFALSTVGLLLIIVGFQNTYKQFGDQVVKDFTGEGNFIYWLAALGGLGAIGYIKPLQPLSRILMILVILAVFLSKGSVGKNFFSNFTDALKTGTSKINTGIGAPLPQAGAGGGSGGGGGGNDSGGFNAGDAASLVDDAVGIASFFGF